MAAVLKKERAEAPHINEPVDAKKTLAGIDHPAELLNIIDQEAKVKNASALSLAAYDKLKGILATIDIDKVKRRQLPMREVAELGRRTKTESAEAMRKDWRSYLVVLLIENAAQAKHLSRQQLVEAIRGYNILRRYLGQNGGQVKRSTITSWLTLDLEQEIRNEALANHSALTTGQPRR